MVREVANSKISKTRLEYVQHSEEMKREYEE